MDSGLEDYRPYFHQPMEMRTVMDVVHSARSPGCLCLLRGPCWVVNVAERWQDWVVILGPLGAWHAVPYLDGTGSWAAGIAGIHWAGQDSMVVVVHCWP